MKLTASRSPRLSLALGLLTACGLGLGYGTPAAHAQSSATAPAAAAPATAAPAVVPAPADTSAAPSSPAATSRSHRGSQGMTRYLTALHQDLKITPDEAPQWTAFADAMRANAAELGQAYRSRRQQLPTMNATEDLNSFIQVEQMRLDGLKKSADAFSALYAAMPADQKKVADAVFLSDLPGAPHRKGPAKAKPAQ